MATSKIQSQTGIIPFVMQWAGTTIYTSGLSQFAFSDAINISELATKMEPGVFYTIIPIGPIQIAAAGGFVGMWVKNDASYTSANIEACVARARAIGSNFTLSSVFFPFMLIPVRV